MIFKSQSGWPRLLAFYLIAAASAIFAADPAPDGRQIYSDQCARCHGANGEGVKGKYDEPLQGDWSLAKLVRVISKTMPDDKDEKCVGPAAEAVARFVNDTFYSAEARARRNPVRVELAHLTNLQYLNSVADLVKQFSERDAPVGPERGLRGSYYDSRNFAGDKKVYDQIDPGLNFDFGSGVPRGGTTNEFSISWRGSLLPAETGTYEFTVRTPNGMRLWVNDDEPLIDAWVSSGQMDEHRASLRLIGGRAYPIRIECFRFKEKTFSVKLLWKPPQGIVEVIPARNLSPNRTTPTFVATTPFPADDSSFGYERGIAVSKEWDEAATRAALETAAEVGKRLDRLSNSKPGDADRAAKVEAFCAKFVAAAFRRPLSDGEKQAYVSAWFKDNKLDEAVKRVVLLSLKSPRFLYPGLDRQEPADFARASDLALALWDSLPDADLAKAASEGKLRTRAEIAAQANRMLADPRARAKIRHFFGNWLQLRPVEELAKDDKLYPGFSPEIISDLRTSLDQFVEDVVWTGNSDYRNLLRADYIYVNERLAGFYGISAEAHDDFVKATVDPKQRSGVLTHPYLLAALSYPKMGSPIHRGVFLTRRVVGRALKPPPVAVAFKDADFAPNLTMREKVTELTRNKACQGCHSVINPLGFTLEQYDAVGRFRTAENGRVIDAATDYQTDDGETVRLTGPADVARFAIASEHAQKAFAEQLFQELVKQPALAYGGGVMERLRQSFVASGFNIRNLIVEIAATAALRDTKPTALSKNL